MVAAKSNSNTYLELQFVRRLWIVEPCCHTSVCRFEKHSVQQTSYNLAAYAAYNRQSVIASFDNESKHSNGFAFPSRANIVFNALDSARLEAYQVCG